MDRASQAVLAAFAAALEQVADERTLMQAVERARAPQGQHWVPSAVIAALVREGYLQREVIYALTDKGRAARDALTDARV